MDICYLRRNLGPYILQRGSLSSSNLLMVYCLFRKPLVEAVTLNTIAIAWYVTSLLTNCETNVARIWFPSSTQFLIILLDFNLGGTHSCRYRREDLSIASNNFSWKLSWQNIGFGTLPNHKKGRTAGDEICQYQGLGIHLEHTWNTFTRHPLRSVTDVNSNVK